MMTDKERDELKRFYQGREAGKGYFADRSTNPYRSTVMMAEFARRNGFFSTSPRPGAAIWDPACGTGSELAYLGRLHSSLSFIGSDLIGGFINHAADRYSNVTNVSFQVGNFFDPPEDLKSKVRSVWFSQTLLLFDDWREILRQLTSDPIEEIVFSTLMYDGPIESAVRHKLLSPDGSIQHEVSYNVLSVPLVIEFMKSIGWEHAAIEAFRIDVPLPPPDRPGLGSYTVSAGPNNHLILSGWQTMPWHFGYFRRKVCCES